MKKQEGSKDKKIALTNAYISNLIQQPSQLQASFKKMNEYSVVVGKIQYWIYRVQKHILGLFKDCENIRIKLAKEFCNKDEDGEPIFVDAQYEFEPDQKILHGEKIAALTAPVGDAPTRELTKEEKDAIAEQYCKKDKKGKPIKSKGNLLDFTDENLKKFNKEYVDMLMIENILPFDKIIITAENLEKMNGGKDKPITIQEMLTLEDIFEFTE